uniref:Uncharacterized protein n=1 Tax=Glossina palpalis gambiensis TaxID=67801 RepID=A0A1B0B2A6_9MUSC
MLASIKGNLSKGDIKNGFAVLVIVLGVLAKVVVIGVTKLEFCAIFFFVVSAVLILFVVLCFIAIAECKSKSAPVAVGVMTTVIISDVVGFLLVFADVGFALVCPLRVAFNFGFIEAAAVAVAIAVTVEFFAFMVKSGGGSVLMTSLNGSGVVISTKRDIIGLKSSKGSLGTKPPSVFVGVSVKFDAKVIGNLDAGGGKGLKVEFTFPFVEITGFSTVKISLKPSSKTANKSGFVSGLGVVIFFKIGFDSFKGIILGFNGFATFNAFKEALDSLFKLPALALIWKISVADANSTGNIGFVCVKLISSVVLVQIPDAIAVEVSVVVSISVVLLIKSTTSVDKVVILFATSSFGFNKISNQESCSSFIGTFDLLFGEFMLCIICDVFWILLLSSVSVSEDPNNKSKKLIPLVVCVISTAASVVVCKGMGLGVDCKPSTSKSSLNISLLLLSINSKPSRRVSKKLFSVEPPDDNPADFRNRNYWDNIVPLEQLAYSCVKLVRISLGRIYVDRVYKNIYRMAYQDPLSSFALQHRTVDPLCIHDYVACVETYEDNVCLKSYDNAFPAMTFP